ncbi:hypothetical protein, partial [Salmonella enterica]|uniref:hypothetical protein n=1 Tax=Salmonella enterica TaxID=28901 RepID=UPI00329A2017
ATVPKEQRTAWLKAAPAPAGSKAPVLQARQEDWDAAMDKLPGVTTVQVDLDGDAKPESVRGQLETWSSTSLEVRRGDTGDTLAYPA